jgi:phosphate-selective porin OprO and OprP
MGINNRGLATALVAGTSIFAIGVGQASAQSAPDDTAALRAQVQQLSALVQQVQQKDQSEIADLKAQVAALQSRLDQAQTTAQPRAAQNATENAQIAQLPEQSSSATAQPRVVQNSQHRLAFESADGRYSIGLTGIIQVDAGDYLNFQPASKLSGPQELSDGVNARRARIGVTGTAADFAFAFVWDGGNSQDTTAKGIQTAQIIYTGIRHAAFELGYSNTFFTLDQSTSAGDLMFLERASPSNIATNFNAGDNRFNVGARYFDDRFWFGGYFTGPAIGDSHTLTGERFGAFERATVQALKGDDYSLHLGVGLDELLRAPNSGNGTPDILSLSDQPELRIDPTTFLNTGTIGSATHPVTGGYVLDVETAAAWKSLFWQGEYYHYDVATEGQPSAKFDGGYGQIAWAITGETHPYNPQAGSYFRLSPAHPFSLHDGGWGAWEIAARISYVDLNSNFIPGQAISADPGAVDGGKQTAYSLGLNWYPNDLVRFMIDYSHVDYDKINGVAATGLPLGAPIGAKIDAIAVRAQVAY